MNDQNFENIPCNICGSTTSTIVYPSQRTNDAKGLSIEEFRSSGDEQLKDPLVKCSQCGFKYVSPRIKPQIVMEGYTSTPDETFVSQAKGREKTFKRCLSFIVKEWRMPPGRVLDIGTGNGSFLKVAKDAGWEVAGCEPNKWLVDWCAKNYSIGVSPGTVFDAKYPNEHFDVITLWDVLEHTPDPAATLRECVRILRPGGLLVVNYPDIGSWIASLMGRRWVFLLSVHYFYYTKETMSRTLASAGLRALRAKPHFQSLELDYILTRALPYTGAVGAVLKKLFRAIHAGSFQIPYWMGQTLMIAKKPK